MCSCTVTCSHYKASTDSPITENWNPALQGELDAVGQHQVLRDFVELLEGSIALPGYLVYK